MIWGKPRRIFPKARLFIGDATHAIFWPEVRRDVVMTTRKNPASLLHFHFANQNQHDWNNSKHILVENDFTISM